MTRRLALAVSPHLDDAVWSAGALLHLLSSSGWRVVVATCFTASVPAPSGFALACQLDKGLPADVDYLALRREEDERACALLGVEPVHLGLPEAPHRGYASAPELFAGLRPGDGAVAAVGEALRRLDMAPDLLLAPQALGDHVDHLAVATAVQDRPEPTWWWADVPYVLRCPEAARGQREVAPDEVKVAAALAYETQLGFQFGGPEEARAALLALPERFVGALA